MCPAPPASLEAASHTTSHRCFHLSTRGTRDHPRQHILVSPEGVQPSSDDQTPRMSTFMKEVAISSLESKFQSTRTRNGSNASPLLLAPRTSYRNLSSQIFAPASATPLRGHPVAVLSHHLPMPGKLFWFLMPLRHQTKTLLQTVECVTSPAGLLRQCQRCKIPAPDLNSSGNLSIQPSLQRRHLAAFSRYIPSRTTRPTPPTNSSCSFPQRGDMQTRAQNLCVLLHLLLSNPANLCTLLLLTIFSIFVYCSDSFSILPVACVIHSHKPNFLSSSAFLQ